MGKRKKKGKPRRRKKEAITSRNAPSKRSDPPSPSDEDDSTGPEQPPDESASDDGYEQDEGPESEGDRAEEERADLEDESLGGDDGAPPSSPESVPPSGSGLPGGAAWGLPLVRFERRWSWLESRLLFVALAALIVILCIWISLSGMSSPVEAPNAGGTVYRAIVAATLLFVIGRLIGRRLKLSKWQLRVVGIAAMVLGCALAPLWRSAGIEYFTGWLNWLQEGSTVTLMHGLRGMGTRLTILVALLGASLAAASGTHINIDVVVRFLKPRWRKPVAVCSGLAAALVCFVASWGFFDYIAMEGYHVDSDAKTSVKISKVASGVGEQFFYFRKQVGLDLRALPAVISGKQWDADDRMNGREWNEWLESAGFVDRYSKEEIATLRAPDNALDEPRAPFVVQPGPKPASGLLIRGMDLFIFPPGFFLIGLRFLLRVLLMLAGHISADPDARTEEEEDEETAPSPPDTAEEVA